MPRGTVGFGEEKCGFEFLGKNFRKFHGTGPSKVRRGLEEGPGEVLSEERWWAETGRAREDPEARRGCPGRDMSLVRSVTCVRASLNKRTECGPGERRSASNRF